MTFVKIVKNKAYFKRYQTKFRRRREGKTDYYARQRLVLQDKNKYDSPKYRLVARFTNRKVIAQIIYATLKGDRVLCSAYSTELANFGVKAGYKNYPASYATGLLVARRLLKQLGMDSDYQGVTDVDGEVSLTEEEGDRNPFKVIFDVGLRRVTLGCRLMGVMKGASDGGLFLNHNEKNFPGYDRESKKFEAGVLKDRIFGNHISEYMSDLQEESPEKFAQVFGSAGGSQKNNRGSYAAAGVAPDSLEDMWTKAHAAIRADPSFKKAAAGKVDKKFKNAAKLTREQRQERVDAKKAEFEAAEEEEESDDE